MRTLDNGLDFSNVTLVFTAIPEPSTSALLLSELVAISFLRRRK